MNREEFFRKLNEPDGVNMVLMEMNHEINKIFAILRDMNAYGGQKIDKDLVSVDDETYKHFEAKKSQMFRGDK